MRAALSLLLVVLVARPAQGQLVRVRRAFEPAVGFWVGISTFGERLSVPGQANYRYSGSLTLGARADVPLTRRTALLVDLGVAPIAAQRVSAAGGGTIGESVENRLVAGMVDVGLGARIRAQAPVFFFLGGGATVATKYASPEVSGTAFEPHAAIGAGFDAARRGAWNLRVAVTGRVVFPADPGDERHETRSRATDWTFQVGGRRTLGRVRTTIAP